MTGAWSADRIGVKLSPSPRFYGQSDSDASATFGHAERAPQTRLVKPIGCYD